MGQEAGLSSLSAESFRGSRAELGVFYTEFLPSGMYNRAYTNPRLRSVFGPIATHAPYRSMRNGPRRGPGAEKKTRVANLAEAGSVERG
jgi:hypothetical protein